MPSPTRYLGPGVALMVSGRFWVLFLLVAACGALHPVEARPPVATSAPRVATAAPSAEVEERSRRHFAQYQGGGSFEFFERDFAPRVERYLDLKDIAAADLARVARQFYAHKTQVSLTLRPGSVAVSSEPGGVAASFVLTMSWSVEPPAAAAGCGYLDNSMHWQPHSLVERRVEVPVRILFDDAGRIRSYEEGPIATPRLRLATRGEALEAFPALPTTPARHLDATPASVMVPDGTLVEDLGETFTCGLDTDEVDTVRKVRFHARPLWLLASWAHDTLRSFIGEDHLLVPVP